MKALIRSLGRRQPGREGDAHHRADFTPPNAAGGRPFTAWDLISAAAIFSLGAVLTWAAARPYRPRGSYGLLMGTFLALGLILLLGVAVGVVSLARRQHLALRSAPGTLLRVWIEPSRDWMMFVFGVLVTVPMAAYFTRVILGDADSARIVASVLFVQQEGPGYLIRSQDNLLPHALFGPGVALGSIALMKTISIASVQALAGVVSYISWKLYRSVAAALASILALLAFRVIPDRAGLLPMYPVMLALGYLGVFCAYRAIHSEGRRRLLLSIAAGMCLALAAEAQNVGLFFFVVPAFLVFTASLRRSVQGLWRVYLALAVFYLPRAIINVADGGLSLFFLNRVDFWTKQGYLTELQVHFYRQPLRLEMGEYLRKWVGQIPRLAGHTGLVPLALAAAALPLRRGRLRWFALVSAAYFVVPIILVQGPFFPRYYAPVFVGVAIAVGAAIPLLRPRRRVGRIMVAACLVGLIIAAGISFSLLLDKTRAREAAVMSGPYRALAQRVDDGKGVIGARSVVMVFANPRIRTYGGQFLSEQDYVTYLTWPSDQRVIEMMRAHNIGWVLISPWKLLETRFNNVWLVPHYGKRARQVRAVAASPNFCLAMKQGGFSLYRFGPCAAG